MDDKRLGIVPRGWVAAICLFIFGLRLKKNGIDLVCEYFRSQLNIYVNEKKNLQ